MRRMKIGVACAALAACVAGCGSGGRQAVGCDWFEGSNCYKDTLAAAGDCLPDPAGPDGVLGADGAACTYADGTQVIFHTPFDPAGLDSDSYLWDVEVRAAGQTCIRVIEGEDGDLRVGSPAGDYVQTTAGFSLHMTCPDGDRFEVPYALDLFECEDMLAILPGHTTFWGEDYVSLSLAGGPDGDLPLFSCSR